MAKGPLLYFKWCERGDLNPYGFPPDPKSGASAGSATLAFYARVRYVYYTLTLPDRQRLFLKIANRPAR